MKRKISCKLAIWVYVQVLVCIILIESKPAKSKGNALKFFVSPFHFHSICDEIPIIWRSKWKARPPKEPLKPIDPVSHVFIHHSALGNCSTFDECSSAVREIQILHQDVRNWTDIGYNWLIGGDGNIYEGRNWDRESAQVFGFNRISIGICLLGNFMEILPSEELLSLTQKLIRCGFEEGKIKDDYHVHGHRDAGTTITVCPGDNVYTKIQQWPRYKTGPLIPQQAPGIDSLVYSVFNLVRNDLNYLFNFV